MFDMTRVAIEREILELVDEDLYGLWEIGWRLNTALGVDPASDPDEAAPVVESLRQRHLVELYVREWVDGSPLPIAVFGRSIDLATRSARLVPKQSEPQFLLGSGMETRAVDGV